jgi:short-subunit dehydrogenase
MNLSGRTVLLTGATGGIGQAIARSLASRGAKLILTGRRAEVLEPLAADTGGTARTCDLADRAAVDALIAESGDVDVLIANAALPASGDLLSFSREQIDRALDVNLRAPIVLARELGERMKARGSGHLVFISSLSGKTASPGTSIYSATKFGMRGFALALREDFHGTGIGVTTVFPGFISDAGMFADSGAKLPSYVGTKTAQEVADAVVRGIERNKAEVDVAPIGMRVGAMLGSVIPGTAAAVQRRLGSADVSAGIAAGQTDKR